MSDRPLHELADLITPMAIRVAATLHLADHIDDGSRTAADLAAVTAADRDALDRLLRHLESVGVLTRDADGAYGVTELGRALRAERFRAVLDLDGPLGRGDLAFADLLHSVRTGEPAFPVRYGAGFWEDLAADPQRRAAYDERMGHDAHNWAAEIVPAYDWGSLGHVVDVGGGDGTFLTAILAAHPALRGTVIDLPQAAATAARTLADAGLDDRAGAVGSSFFDPLPVTGAGGYVLCAILHDWDDESARRILSRCAEAVRPDGRVLVIERIGEDGEHVSTAMDLRMLVYFGGRERGVGDIERLASDGGLALADVHHAGTLAIVELRRA